MATKIRLKRMGKIRSPHYRIIVIDSRAKRDGRAIEEIGIYQPKNDPSIIRVDSERARYWLGVGAQPTPAVEAILKLTGDWQAHTGDTSIPSGVKPQADPKDKAAIFAAALAEADDAPRTSAITTKKKADDAEGETTEGADAGTDDQAAKPEVETTQAPAEGADDATAQA